MEMGRYSSFSQWLVGQWSKGFQFAIMCSCSPVATSLMFYQAFSPPSCIYETISISAISKCDHKMPLLACNCIYGFNNTKCHCFTLLKQLILVSSQQWNTEFLSGETFSLSPVLVVYGNIHNVLRLFRCSGRKSSCFNKDKQRVGEQHSGICLFLFLKQNLKEMTANSKLEAGH